MSDKEKTCFFITPIGDEGTDERKYSDALLATLKSILPSSLLRIRQDMIHRSDREYHHKITQDMQRSLFEDDLCIVDLTDLNPNVMWEFGYRFAVGKQWICIAKKGTELPFDTHDCGVIEYIFSEDMLIDGAFPGKLMEAVAKIADGDFNSTCVVESDLISKMDVKIGKILEILSENRLPKIPTANIISSNNSVIGANKADQPDSNSRIQEGIITAPDELSRNDEIKK